MSRTRDLSETLSEVESWVSEIEGKLDQIVKLADEADSIEVKEELHDLLNEIKSEAENALYVLK